MSENDLIKYIKEMKNMKIIKILNDDDDNDKSSFEDIWEVITTVLLSDEIKELNKGYNHKPKNGNKKNRPFNSTK